MYLENAKDEIHIDRLEVYAYHGVFPIERRKGQTFVINAVLYTDTRKPGLSDRLEQSTDYGDVCHFMTDWMRTNTCNLIEAAAERLAQAVLLKYSLICGISLEICKPEAPVRLPFGNISVKIVREWHKAYISVGSNMGDRKGYIESALEAMKANPLMRVGRVSELIETEPYGGVEQDKFLNGAIELETLLSPHELLDALHEMEAAAGRERKVHWGPRTLDLDILFYDKLILEDDMLVIPHPDLENRSFVLKPMKAIAPNYRHPLLGRTVTQMWDDLSAGCHADN